MMDAFNNTVCQKCSKVVPSAPGVCVVCGHEFGATVHVVGTGTQDSGQTYPVMIYSRAIRATKQDMDKFLALV